MYYSHHHCHQHNQQQQPPEKWSAEQVADLFVQRGQPSIAAVLAQNKVNGEALLNMNQAQARQLGLSPEQRTQLFAVIGQL